MCRTSFASCLCQLSDRTMPSLHQPATYIAVRRLRNIGEFPADMKIGRMDETKGHGQLPSLFRQVTAEA
jgi:hypothetical protein